MILKIWSLNGLILLRFIIQIQTGMNTPAGSYINSRLVSSSQKRQIMWNIIEPGDPYDIRKSMIAKLPGRKNFMGDHLELVCLLQAAEIERISQYVDQYKLKFREIERRQLDRHSYEIQIKELTQQLGDEGNYRLQNAKLKEFLRKQTIEFEQMKKKAGGFEIDLSRKYEESLRQIDSLYQQNELVKSNLHKARLDYQQSLSSKSSQIEQLERRLRDAASRNSQFNQKTQSYYKLEIEYKKLEFENKRIKEITQTKNKEIEELQSKSKQLIYQIEEMNSQLRQYGGINHTITEYENRFALLGQEIDRLNLVLREKTGEISDLNNRYKILEDDSRRKADYIEELERKKIQTDQKYMQMELKLSQSIRSLSGLDESRSLVRTYEGNLEKLSSEVQRLNSVLRKKVQELDESNRKISQYEYELRISETVKHQVEDYRLKYGQFNKKFSEYESRIALLSQQIQRLNQNLKRKNEECNIYEQQIKSKNEEIDSYHKKCYDLEFEFKGEISKLSHQNRQYEIEVTELSRDRENSRSKIQQLLQKASPSSPSKVQLEMEQFYKSQIQKLNQIIREKTNEVQRLEYERMNTSKGDSKMFEVEKQRIIQQFQLQLVNRNKQIEKGRQTLSQYEKRIITSLHQIQRLNALLKKTPSPEQSEDFIRLERKITQYENRLAIMNQQIERLNENLRSKVSQCKHLQAKLSHYELEATSSRKRQIDSYQMNISELERRISELQRENRGLGDQLRSYQEQLSRRSSDNQLTANANRQNQLKIRQLNEQNISMGRKVSEYEFQLSSLSQEVQRLNNVLRSKVEEVATLQQKNQNVNYELESSRKQIGDLELRIQQTTRQIQMSKDNQLRNAQYEIQTLKVKISQLESYKEQCESRIRDYQQKVRIFGQKQQRISGQFNDNQRRIAQYENKMAVLSQEIERLNDILGKMNNENSELKRRASQVEYLKSTIVTLEEKFNIAVQENDALRQGVSQTNLHKTKLSQEYEDKIRNLVQSVSDLQRKNHEYESKLTYANRQLEHLSSVVKSKVEENSSFDSKVRTMYEENQILNRKIHQLTNSNRKIAEYDNKITVLSQQIQRLNGILKTKIGEIHNLEEKCRNREGQLLSYQRKAQQYENTINRQLQTKIQYLSSQNEELKVKLRQVTSEVNKLPEFESKFAKVYAEVQRLNNILRSKNQEITTLESRYRNAEDESTKYRRRNDELEGTMHRELKNQSSVFEQRVGQLSDQNDSLRKKIRQLTDQNRKIPDYENKLALLSNQIERLNEILAKYSKDMLPNLEEQTRSLSFENDDLRRKVTELSEINKGNQELLVKYKVTVQQNQQYYRKLQEYETRMTHVSGQIERINGAMRTKVEQLNDSDKRLRQAISENQTMKKKLRDFEDVSRSIPEYENQLAILRSEIERLNGVLKSKVDENSIYDSELRKYKYEYETLQRRYSEIEVNLRQYKESRNVYEQKLSSFNQENEDLRRNIRELSDSNRKISEYQSRMVLLSQEIERMNGNLRSKMEELSQTEDSFRNYKRQSESKISHLNNEIEQYRRKTNENMNSQSNRIAEYENKLLLLSQQIERLNYVLKEHTYEIEMLQKKQQQYLTQIERLNNTLRLKVQETSRWEQSNNDLKSRLKSYEEHLNLAGQEYEKIKGAHSILNEEHIKANKHLVQYEQSINKLYQEFERIQSMLQDYKKQNYQLKLQLQESGNLVEKNRALSAEIDRLNGIIKVQNKDLQDLRLSLSDQASLQKRINEYMAMMVVLFAQIQSLRQRVKETQIEIESVRRSSLAPFKV